MERETEEETAKALATKAIGPKKLGPYSLVKDSASSSFLGKEWSNGDGDGEHLVCVKR